MFFEFCVRVLVISLLDFGQHANALSYRSGGSSGIMPHFDYPGNHKPAFASTYERSAHPGGFLGSSGSSHSESGRVDSYSPERSVFSYLPGSRIIQKPTQDSQQAPPANANANGVFQTKDAMWDFALPKNGKRFGLGIASSSGIGMQAGPQPRSKPQQTSYWPRSKPQQTSYWPRSKPQQTSYWPRSKPQQTSYRPRTIYRPPQGTSYGPPPKPQEPIYRPPQGISYGPPPKPQEPIYRPPQGINYGPPPKPQEPIYRPPQGISYRPPPKPQEPIYRPPQGINYGPPPKPQESSYRYGMRDYPSLRSSSGPNVQPADLNVDPRSSRQFPMASPDHPRWQNPLVLV
ncbi:uncharacterized protein [Cebidichthys violaceus]|uniref:uncharacterized protein n=1 Tax=Cebidichthys violaceus TaxID=271503 RepID=UPI0035C96961